MLTGRVADPEARSTARLQRGAGLIELMLALLVFSVAMTGWLSVQVMAMQASADALHRSVATLLAQDLFSRLRANPGELGRYLGAGLGDARRRRPLPATDCDREACTPDELAVYDLWHWESLLLGELARSGGREVGGLPVARACISREGPGARLAIYWRGAPVAASLQGSLGCELPEEGLYDDSAQPPGNQHRRRALAVWGTVEHVRS